MRAERRDREFLPAAIEILEMPPSPIAIALLLAICALVIIALSWAYLGRIDIIASAEGKIHPTGRVKVIQSLETGKVRSIDVQNGDRVISGQTLITLDDTEARAQVIAAQMALASYRAEMTRRTAGIAVARAINLDNVGSVSPPQLNWDDGIQANIRAREEATLAGDQSRLLSELSGIVAQIAQKRANEQSLQQTIAAQAELISTLKDRAAIRESLLGTQAGSKSDWLDTMEKVKTEQVTLASVQGQVADTRADLSVLQRELSKTRDTFIADQLQKLADAARQADDLEQKLVQATAQLAHFNLTSPIDGTVQDSSITTIGQVLTMGTELMRIVPTDSKLDIEAYLPNTDVGFVSPGQSVNVKIHAFPFTRYGTIPGKVLSVARDAIPEPDAQSIMADPARTTAGLDNITGQADRTQNLVFPVTAELDRNSIMADGQEVSLSPGMAVTVEIRTGRRRILEYLFSPIVEVGAVAMHER
ncbi:hemolysin D [Rhizobium pisi]